MQSPSDVPLYCEGNRIHPWALTGRLVGGMETVLREGFIKIWMPLNFKNIYI